MQKLIAPFLFAGLFVLAGCGAAETAEPATKAESPKNISVRFEKRETAFDSNYARFATFRKGLILTDSAIHDKNERVDAVVHRIYLANYDLQLTDPSKQDYQRISSDGQFRVSIQIEADKDAPDNAALKVGEYGFKKEPFNRVSHVFLSYLKDGKDMNVIVHGEETGGKVRITSVTGTEIQGEIDISDKDESVKGTFTARRLGK
jgi:hypothetical protein